MVQATKTEQKPDAIVVVERVGACGILTINRPDVLNALNRDVLDTLDARFTELEEDDEVRGIILTGAGDKAFVAGADIAQMVDQGPVEASRMARRGQALLSRLENSPKVVVAAVNGYALGGGCELAMACDFIVASENARFGQPEVAIGVTPGFAGTQRLARLVGKARAKELILTGRQIDAAEAFSIGLAVKVVPAKDLMPTCQAIVAKIASNAPIAVRLSKEVINRGANIDLEAASQMEADAFAVCFSTDDQKEGMRAFLEKRKPAYKGA